MASLQSVEFVDNEPFERRLVMAGANEHQDALIEGEEFHSHAQGVHAGAQHAGMPHRVQPVGKSSRQQSQALIDATMRSIPPTKLHCRIGNQAAEVFPVRLVQQRQEEIAQTAEASFRRGVSVNPALQDCVVVVGKGSVEQTSLVAEAIVDAAGLEAVASSRSRIETA